MAWLVHPERHGVVVSGDVAGPEGATLAEALRALPSAGEVVLDLADLDLDDGVAVAHLVTGLRALRARCDRLVLVAAPQMLAHTLYKVGALSDPGLVLVAPRQDEGMGAG